MVDSPLQTPDQERRKNNTAGVELPALGKPHLQLHSFQSGRRNILFVTSDLAKTGGPGEVSAALPRALPRALAGLHDVRAQPTGIRRSSSDSILRLIVNAHYQPIDFRLPQVLQVNGWCRLLDTARVDGEREVFAFDREYEVATGRCCCSN